MAPLKLSYKVLLDSSCKASLKLSYVAPSKLSYKALLKRSYMALLKLSYMDPWLLGLLGYQVL